MTDTNETGMQDPQALSDALRQMDDVALNIDGLLARMSAPDADVYGAEIWVGEITRVVQPVIQSLERASELAGDNNGVETAKATAAELREFLEQLPMLGDPRPAAQSTLGRKSDQLHNIAFELSGGTQRSEPEFVPADFGTEDTGKQSKDGGEGKKQKRGRFGRGRGGSSDTSRSATSEPVDEPVTAPVSQSDQMASADEGAAVEEFGPGVASADTSQSATPQQDWPVDQATPDAAPSQTTPQSTVQQQPPRPPRPRSMCRLAGCRTAGALDSTTAVSDSLMKAWQMIRSVPLEQLDGIERAVENFERESREPSILNVSDFERQVAVWGYLAAQCADVEGLQWELRLPQQTITSSQDADSDGSGEVSEGRCIIEFNFEQFDKGGMLVWSWYGNNDEDSDAVAVSWLPYHADRGRDGLTRKTEAVRLVGTCVKDQELTYKVATERLLAVEAALPVELRKTPEWDEAVISATRNSDLPVGADNGLDSIVSSHTKNSLAALLLLLQSTS